VQKIKDHFSRHTAYESPIEDIFWINLPQELLTEIQKEHFSSCGPYVMSLEIGDSWIKLELLVRPPSTLSCSCMQYATSEQRKYGMDILDEVFQELQIPT